MTSKHNLPRQLTSFVGRAPEMADVIRLLERVPLLTLTGPGGTGKTRLALEVATQLCREEKFDGIYFIGLAPVSDPELVLPTIAHTLGVRESAEKDLFSSLIEHLHDRRTLLVLDNFEQILGAAPLVADLLGAASGLQVLATSRAPLRISGEQEYPVPALVFPEKSRSSGAGSSDPGALVAFEAVDLFVQRASLVRHDFVLDKENADIVVEICRRLDGLPLAIELAAARVKVLPPKEILPRLGEGLDLLARGPVNLPARQQAMRNSIAWSYDLLTEEEKRFFRRAAVFAGGWSIEAASAVCNCDGTLKGLILDELTSLLEQSLIVREDRAGELRFRMLQPLRDFALEELQAADEDTGARNAHLSYYTALVGQTAQSATGSDQARWLRDLAQENDNLRAALAWSHAAPDRAVAGLRLAAGLSRYWEMSGTLSEGRRWLEDALAAATASLDSPAESGARVESAESPSDLRAAVHNGAGTLAFHEGDYGGANTHYEAALALWQEMNDERGTIAALANMGNVASRAGDYERAEEHFRRVLPHFREAGDTWSTANTLHNLGHMMRIRGNDQSAADFYEEALALRKELGEKRGAAASLNALGDVYAAQGRLTEAVAFNKESLTLRQELSIPPGIVDSLESIAQLTVRLGLAESAIRLFGAAQAMRDSTSLTLSALQKAEYERSVESARIQIPARFDEVWTDGRTMEPEQALDFASELLDDLDTLARGAAKERAGKVQQNSKADKYPAGLTRREVEVLRLVATGLTDAQVAERLFLSTQTVHAHLRNIYSKLDVANRLEATRFAIEHNLA